MSRKRKFPGFAPTAHFWHADDWSRAKMACVDCGAEIVAEALPVRKLNRRSRSRKHRGELTPLAVRMRHTVEDQLASVLVRWGCPHVGKERETP